MFLLLAATPLVQGQDAKKPKEPTVDTGSVPPAASGDKSGTLVIVADGEPDSKEKTVRAQVVLGASIVLRRKKALGDKESFPEKNVVVEELPREDFERLSQFILGGPLPDRGEAAKVGLRPDRGGSWVLDLGGPYSLSKLVVQYENSKTGEKTSEEFKPDVEGATGGRYRMKALGRYIVDGVTKKDTKDADLRPSQFTVHPSDGLKAMEPIVLDIPAEKSHWMITLSGFDESDHMALFEALADPEMFASPLVSKKVSARKLVLGSLAIIDSLVDVTIVGSNATFRFTRPPGSKANRVWMKFPLTSEEAAAELAQYRKDFDQFEMPKQIREEKPLMATPDGRLVPRESGSKSGYWYEIPTSKDGLSFERTFTIDRIETWKEISKDAPWQLIVYELDPLAGGKQAYLSSDPKSKSKAKYPVRSEQVLSWPVGLRSAGK